MHLSSALAASVLALQASAFLIPLEVSKAAEAAEAAKGQIESLWMAKAQRVALACSQCPFYLDEQQLLEQRVDSTIVRHLPSGHIRRPG